MPSYHSTLDAIYLGSHTSVPPSYEVLYHHPPSFTKDLAQDLGLVLEYFKSPHEEPGQEQKWKHFWLTSVEKNERPLYLQADEVLWSLMI